MSLREMEAPPPRPPLTKEEKATFAKIKRFINKPGWRFEGSKFEVDGKFHITVQNCAAKRVWVMGRPYPHMIDPRGMAKKTAKKVSLKKRG